MKKEGNKPELSIEADIVSIWYKVVEIEEPAQQSKTSHKYNIAVHITISIVYSYQGKNVCDVICLQNTE